MSFRKTCCAHAAWLFVLAGCGGGGSSSTTTNPPAGGGGSTKTAITGKVIDGYVSGASLCLDLNANQACDAGEPTATSGAGGAYSLDTTGLAAAAVAKAYVLVTAPATAKDEDDAGKTLAEAGKKAFTMLAPVAADTATAGTMVSPLTTLVSQQMISGGLSSAQATQAVRNQLGLSASGSLNIDFKADTSQQALAVLSSVAAVALGELQAAVSAGAPAGSTAQQKLIASLNELSQSIGALKTTLGIDATSTAAVSATLVQQAIQATVVALSANASQSIAAAQGAISGTLSSLETLLAQGFGNLEDWNGACAQGALGCSVYANASLTFGGGGAWSESRYRSDNGGVFVKQAAQNEGWVLGGGGWTPVVVGGTYAAQSDGSFLVTGGDFGAGAIVRLRVQDLAGQAMSSVSATGAASSKIFPAGSQALWGSYIVPETYRLYPDTVRSFTTLSGTVAGFQSPAAGQPVGDTWGWNGLEYTFDGALVNSGGVVSFWSRDTGALLGKGQYEVRTVNGQQVLVVTAIPNAAITDAATRDSYILREYGNGRRPAFAVYGGVAHSGKYQAAGTVIDTQPGLNKVGLNALLLGQGLCQLPDAGGASVCP